MNILKKAKSIYTLGHWKHVPVHFHWSILLVLPWYYLSTWKLIEATIALVGYALLILVHELGHGLPTGEDCTYMEFPSTCFMDSAVSKRHIRKWMMCGWLGEE